MRDSITPAHLVSAELRGKDREVGQNRFKSGSPLSKKKGGQKKGCRPSFGHNTEDMRVPSWPKEARQRVRRGLQDAQNTLEPTPACGALRRASQIPITGHRRSAKHGKHRGAWSAGVLRLHGWPAVRHLPHERDGRVRPRCRFEQRGAGPLRESGMRQMGGVGARQCDRTLGRHRGGVRGHRRGRPG